LLTGADLRTASFQGAKLTGAVLDSADLRGAHFKGADLSDTSLDGATWDDTTCWPQGFTPPQTIANEGTPPAP
ncbi:MAG: pentapeptide repeat-containing protein, partial [Myxococcota bacterium]